MSEYPPLRCDAKTINIPVTILRDSPGKTGDLTEPFCSSNRPADTEHLEGEDVLSTLDLMDLTGAAGSEVKRILRHSRKRHMTSELTRDRLRADLTFACDLAYYCGRDRYLIAECMGQANRDYLHWDSPVSLDIVAGDRTVTYGEMVVGIANMMTTDTFNGPYRRR